MLTRAFSRGFALIEMLIVLVIVGVLLALAAQNYRVWIANSQIRTATETLVEGLSAARNEAIKRNEPVAFRLVTDLSASCTASPSGTSWVASVDDPTGACDADISDTLAPYIVAKKSGAEKTATVTIAAVAANGAAASTIVFNGVGRVVLAGVPLARIDIDSSALTAAQSRDLRIMLTTGGLIRMCDPDPSISSTDSRKC